MWVPFAAWHDLHYQQDALLIFGMALGRTPQRVPLRSLIQSATTTVDRGKEFALKGASASLGRGT